MILQQGEFTEIQTGGWLFQTFVPKVTEDLEKYLEAFNAEAANSKTLRKGASKTAVKKPSDKEIKPSGSKIEKKQ